MSEGISEKDLAENEAWINDLLENEIILTEHVLPQMLVEKTNNLNLSVDENTRQTTLALVDRMQKEEEEREELHRQLAERYGLDPSISPEDLEEKLAQISGLVESQNEDQTKEESENEESEEDDKVVADNTKKPMSYRRKDRNKAKIANHNRKNRAFRKERHTGAWE